MQWQQNSRSEIDSEVECVDCEDIDKLIKEPFKSQRMLSDSVNILKRGSLIL